VPTTLAAEVLGLQVSSTAAATAQTLPFTGQSSGYLAGLGVALVGMGGVLMAGARRKEEGSEVVLAGWSSRI
jgi:LPXTG-motif cell wall-anchored protein